MIMEYDLVIRAVIFFVNLFFLVQLWFAIANGFSGQILFDKWCIGLYNVIFTFLPPLAFGLFDRTCSEQAREKVPKLYKNSQQSDLFNVKVKTPCPLY